MLLHGNTAHAPHASIPLSRQHAAGMQGFLRKPVTGALPPLTDAHLPGSSMAWLGHRIHSSFLPQFYILYHAKHVFRKPGSNIFTAF